MPKDPCDRIMTPDAGSTGNHMLESDLKPVDEGLEKLELNAMSESSESVFGWVPGQSLEYVPHSHHRYG